MRPLFTAPESVFAALNREAGAEAECFASPLNAYFANFCSAFVDTDRWFGSRGSFFDFAPREGSYECNPPFVDEVCVCALCLGHENQTSIKIFKCYPHLLVI